jgi:hypothetical protein
VFNLFSTTLYGFSGGSLRMNKHVKNKLYDSTKGFNQSLALLFIRPSSDPLEGRKNDSKNSFAMIFSDNCFIVRGKDTAK